MQPWQVRRSRTQMFVSRLARREERSEREEREGMAPPSKRATADAKKAFPSKRQNYLTLRRSAWLGTS